MEQIKDSLGSQMQTQQKQQQTHQQNQSKKKSKNKKKSSKNDLNTTVTRSIEEQKPIQGVVAENGLTDQLKQQLHIGNDNNSTNLSNSSCSSTSNNTNKVNGLMTENLKKSKSCPPTTNKTTRDKLQQPALNGHHVVNEQTLAVNGKVLTQNHEINKKSKRKPDNKKNTSSSLEENKSQLENGHCPDRVTTNGLSHQETHILENEQSTAMTATTNTTSTSRNNNLETKSESSEQQTREPELQLIQQELQEEASSLETLSKSPTNPVEMDLSNVHIEYKEYESELQMHDIMRLIQAELSEPYSIYTYRYFIYNWPKLCFLAAHGNEYVGAIVCKLDMHRNVRRGYIAMLAVRREYRKLKIGTTLVQKAIEAMLADKADEVVLETEMSNLPALRLYENLGFVRDKRLFRYYLNGVDALRLKLWFR